VGRKLKWRVKGLKIGDERGQIKTSPKAQNEKGGKLSRFLLAKVIPAVTLAFFVAFMNSGTFLKTYGLREPVPVYFDSLETLITQEQWMAAAEKARQMEAAWDKVLRRLQFSEERDEINNFRHSLARMKGYIAAEEKGGALAALNELEETWVDLGK